MDGVWLDSDDAILAAREREFYEDDAIVDVSWIGAGEGFEFVDFGGMGVADFGDGKIAIGEGWFFEARWEFAESKFVLTDAEGDGDASVAPTARATVEVDAATVGDEARFDF